MAGGYDRTRRDLGEGEDDGMLLFHQTGSELTSEKKIETILAEVAVSAKVLFVALCKDRILPLLRLKTSSARARHPRRRLVLLKALRQGA